MTAPKTITRFGGTAEGRSPKDKSIVPADLDEDQTMGLQLEMQWSQVLDGQRHQLLFGAMMLKVKARVDGARAANSATRGPGTKGTGVKGWLETYAPKVSERTAGRLMDLAEGLHEEFKLGKGVDLEELLATALDDLPEKLAKKRAEIEKCIEGKSQRQLLLEFGKAEGKRRGGDTSGKGEKLTPEEEQAAMEKAIREDLSTCGQLIQEITTKRKYFLSKTDADAEGLRDLAAILAEDLTEWLKLPKAKRPATPALEKLL